MRLHLQLVLVNIATSASALDLPARKAGLWLDRLTLRKPDGELITLNLDEYSVVEIEPAAA